METLLAFVVGGLFGASIYLFLQRSMVRMLFGLVLISNAVNLLLFTVGRLTRGEPAILSEQHNVPVEHLANPLPQALILTSIVISFGLLAFGLVLVYRTEKITGNADVDAIGEDSRKHDRRSSDGGSHRS